MFLFENHMTDICVNMLNFGISTDRLTSIVLTVSQLLHTKNSLYRNVCKDFYSNEIHRYDLDEGCIVMSHIKYNLNFNRYKVRSLIDDLLIIYQYFNVTPPDYIQVLNELIVI